MFRRADQGVIGDPGEAGRSGESGQRRAQAGTDGTGDEERSRRTRAGQEGAGCFTEEGQCQPTLSLVGHNFYMSCTCTCSCICIFFSFTYMYMYVLHVYNMCMDYMSIGPNYSIIKAFS